MMHLSSLSKAMINLVVCMLSQAVAHLFPFFSLYALAVSFISSVLGIYFLMEHKHELRHIEAVCNACAHGDLERRAILPKARGDMVAMINAINRLIDVADAYIRESNASAQHAARGLFYRKILPDGLNGTWKLTAEQLNTSSHQVRQNLIESVRGAGTRLEASVMQTIMQLSNSAQQLVTTSESLSGIATQGSREAQSLSVSTSQTSQNMNAIAAAVEEMTAAIKEISSQTAQASTVSREATAEGDAAKTVLENLITSSQKIGEIAELISDIAAQVNLLSLNATIEAARAGDAGKGFAVVASEVKSLATRTSQATEQVEQYIQQARAEITRTNEALNAIINKVGKVNETTCVIAAAVEEQSATALEISRNLQSTSGVTQEFAHSVDLMAQASGNTQAAAGQMHDSSTMLVNIADTLKADIGKFLQSLQNA